jgi:Ca-activated chloride channel family protein
MLKRLSAALLFWWPLSASACDLALVLAVDVSGSVDREEYRIQMDGLAAALRDGIVVDALVDQDAMVTVVQWSGSSRQRQTVPWTQVSRPQHATLLADRIAADPRVWRNFSTAIGEALLLSIELLDQVPDCRRKVIDVSGDGISNEGVVPQSLRPALRARRVTVNALAIETDEADLTAYFFENLIAGEGAFVITADGFADYPAQIRRKLQREVTRQVSQVRNP